jgi:hypothetical protein
MHPFGSKEIVAKGQVYIEEKVQFPLSIMSGKKMLSKNLLNK